MRVIIQSSHRRKNESAGSFSGNRSDRPNHRTDSEHLDLGVTHDHHEELIGRIFTGPEQKQVVAFISTLRGEGVTHVCRSVAAELAATHQRTVVVVDGWALAQKEDADDLGSLHAQPLMGSSEVWVWPEAKSGPQPYLAQDRIPYEFNLVLDQLRREYDFVLLDCPAVQFGRSGIAVAAKAQKAILVVQEGRASRRTVAAAQRSLEIRGALLAGCVLNWGRES
jgi:Mrp family chromosome partitioning ATPase